MCTGSSDGRHAAAPRAVDGQRRDDVLQLAHVAGPVVARERADDVVAERRARSRRAPQASAQNRSASHGTSSGRSRSGGMRDADHVEPEAQVGAEAAGRDLLVERPVGRGDDRASTLRGRFSPTRRISPSCSTRSSFACARGVSSPASSRKIVPWSASSKRPGRSVDGAGERAPRVPEELRFEQVVGERGAVHRAEASRAPAALRA